MRHIVSAWALIAFFAFPAFAQKGPCTEEVLAKPSPPPRTNDCYLCSGMAGKPVGGGS